MPFAFKNVLTGKLLGFRDSQHPDHHLKIGQVFEIHDMLAILIHVIMFPGLLSNCLLNIGVRHLDYFMILDTFNSPIRPLVDCIFPDLYLHAQTSPELCFC